MKRMEAHQDRTTQNNKGELKAVQKFLQVYQQDSNVFIFIFHKMAPASVYKEEMGRPRKATCFSKQW